MWNDKTNNCYVIFNVNLIDFENEFVKKKFMKNSFFPSAKNGLDMWFSNINLISFELHNLLVLI